MFTSSVFDYTTSLFVSIVVCILLILAAEFTKVCFSSIGPSDSERYEALLRDDDRLPYPIAQVCSEHLPCSHTNYESLSQNFPSPNDPLNEALYELSDTSTDSSYIPGSPHPDDSNLEDELGDTTWIRPRRRHRRIQRVPVSSPNIPKE